MVDKKRIKSVPDDLVGFEDFFEAQSESSFLPKQTKKEVSFEYFTFVTNDSERLNKLKNLLSDKLPFALKYEQGNQILAQQQDELGLIKEKLYEINDNEDAGYRKSLGEIFDSFFSPPKI